MHPTVVGEVQVASVATPPTLGRVLASRREDRVGAKSPHPTGRARASAFQLSPQLLMNFCSRSRSRERRARIVLSIVLVNVSL